MARSKMEMILEELAHVISDETTAAMTGPITVPLGKSIESDVPAVDDPEGTAPLGKGTNEPGGDASFYDKEQKKSDFPYAKPDQTESDSAPKIEDPEGKALLGKGTPEKGGDAEHYGDEKTDSKYPFKFDDKKGGAKTEQDDPLSELEKLQKMAEEEPAPSEPVTEPAVPALDGGEPSDEAPEEAPEEIEWELYLHSGDFDLISDRAMEVLKPIADAKVSIAVKFLGDESKKNEVIDALTASGFVVLDVEKEGESEDDAAGDDAEAGEVGDEVISGPADAVAGGTPLGDPAVMAEARRRKAKKRKIGKR